MLIDGCMSPATASRLRAIGHDVAWVGDWSRDPGDREILTTARADGRVLITTDRGFGALAMRQPRGNVGLIVVRRTDAVHQAAVASSVITLHGDDLAAGAVIVATPQKIRVRWPPVDA